MSQSYFYLKYWPGPSLASLVSGSGDHQMQTAIDYEEVQLRARVKLEEEKELFRNAQRIVTIDLIKTWTFAMITTSFLSPTFRPEAQGTGASIWGYVFIILGITVHILMVIYANKVR